MGGGRRLVAPVPALVAIVAIFGVIPAVVTPGFHFTDDSAAVFLPTWRAAGNDLLSGVWPTLRPDFWMGGNWAAEAQFGLWSPVNLLVMVVVALIPNLAVGATIVKVGFAVWLATGTYALAREYGATPWFSVAVASALPITGFTLYYDTSTWVGGLMAFSWTAWFWWAARRVGRGALNPLVAFVIGYLLMTNGNPYGALAALVVLAGVAVETLLARDLRGLARLVVTGLAVGLTVGVAYLPLVMSSAAGWRQSTGIVNDGFLVPDLSMLAATSMPSAMPFIRLWQGSGSTVPLAYSSWFLVPLLPWLPWRILAQRARQLAGLGVIGALYLALALGPSTLWLFRWPARLLPYVWLPVFVALAVLLSAGVRTDRLKLRASATAALVVMGAWLAYSAQTWGTRHAIAFVLHAILVAALVGVAIRWPSFLPGIMIAGTAAVVVAQLTWMPANRDVADWRFPSDQASLNDYAQRFDGPIVQIASPDRIPVDKRPEAWRWVLFGSMPGATGVESTTSYTGIGNSEFSQALCMNHAGATCADALARVFGPAGGLVPVERFADSLRANTVVVSRALVPGAETQELPGGWELAESNDIAVVFRRISPMPWPESRLSAATQGVTVARATSTATSELLVVSTGTEGALQFARLAWPGYTATVGGAPVSVVENPQGLLEVALPGGLRDAEVRVTFAVPGLSVGVPLLLLAFAMVAIQSLTWARARTAGRVELRRH